MQPIYHVILAGGSGSRFWPKSRENKPKQLLKIIGNETMIRLTYNRLVKKSDPENIFVVASQKLCDQIEIEIPEIPIENYIIEPSAKNTAPAIGLAAQHIIKRNSNAIMGIYPSDHLIIDENKFQMTIDKAQEMITQNPTLITIGINPTYPATGYGYIKYDANNKTNIETIYKVEKFVEKPDESTAEKFVKNGDFLWNGGMFIWKAETIINEIKTYMPTLYKSLHIIYNSISTNQYKTTLLKEWETLPSESIDYGILEKTNNVYTAKADFKWNDLGSWKSLFDVLTKNSEQNFYDGDIISLHSENNLVISPNRLTAMIGIKNTTVINLDDVTLIVPHEHAETVKDIVNMLKSLNRNEYI